MSRAFRRPEECRVWLPEQLEARATRWAGRVSAAGLGRGHRRGRRLLSPSSLTQSCVKTRAGLAVVEPEHAAEPLTAFQRTRSDHLCPGRDEFVVKALVRPCLMVMDHELSNGSREVPLPERNDSLQALGFGGQPRAARRPGATPVFLGRLWAFRGLAPTRLRLASASMGLMAAAEAVEPERRLRGGLRHH